MKVVPTMLLDLCCGGGLAADGYRAVGFEMWGVDIEEQEDYPDFFLKGDVLETLESNMPENFVGMHISPPCQLFSTTKYLHKSQGGMNERLDLLTPTLEILRRRWMHKPWIVENVDDKVSKVRAIMNKQKGESLITLCGSMFGLPIQRHRVFLSNIKLRQPLCEHSIWPIDPKSGNPRPWGIYHQPGDNIPGGGRTARDVNHARELLGVYRTLPWETLKEGFPPAYTSHIGADLLIHLSSQGKEQ